MPGLMMPGLMMRTALRMAFSFPAIVTLVFLAARLSGDPLDWLGAQGLTAEDRVLLTRHYGLDCGMWDHYLAFLRGLPAMPCPMSRGTRRLLAAAPVPDPAAARRTAAVPDLSAPPGAILPRRARTVPEPLIAVGPAHFALAVRVPAQEHAPKPPQPEPQPHAGAPRQPQSAGATP